MSTRRNPYRPSISRRFNQLRIAFNAKAFAQSPIILLRLLNQRQQIFASHASVLSVVVGSAGCPAMFSPSRLDLRAATIFAA